MGGAQVQRHRFLTSVPDGSEWSASQPARLTPKKTASVNKQEAGWAPEVVQTFWRRETSVKQIRNYAVIGTRVFIMNYLYEVPEIRAISSFANILPI